MNNEISELKRKLLKYSYRIKDIPDGIFVKLPLGCGVRIKKTDDNFKIEAKFGLLKRTVETWSVCIIALIILFLFLIPFYKTYFDLPFKVLVIIMLFVMGMVWDIYRYILTENLITRIINFLEEINKNS